MTVEPAPDAPLPPTDDAAPPQTLTRLCLASLAGDTFAFDLEAVREVLEVESVTRVPKTPPVLVGLANVRGAIVPLLDLRPLLGLPVGAPDPAFAVVLRHQGHQVGVLVDGVPEICTVPQEDIEPGPARDGEGGPPFVSSRVRIGARVSGVVELPALLASVDG